MFLNITIQTKSYGVLFFHLEQLYLSCSLWPQTWMHCYHYKLNYFMKCSWCRRRLSWYRQSIIYWAH